MEVADSAQHKSRRIISSRTIDHRTIHHRTIHHRQRQVTPARNGS